VGRSSALRQAGIAVSVEPTTHRPLVAGLAGGRPANGVDLPTGEPEHPVRALRVRRVSVRVCHGASARVDASHPYPLVSIADDVISNRHTVGSRVTGRARSAFDVRDSIHRECCTRAREAARSGQAQASVACAEWPRVLMVRPHLELARALELARISTTSTVAAFRPASERREIPGSIAGDGISRHG
jgi:hypothetical protein